MKKIFIDVGANNGQTLRAVLPREFGFDHIYCFEPAGECIPKLQATADGDDRVHIIAAGLWRETTTRYLYEPGRKGATMFQKDPQRKVNDEKQKACFLKASKWFADMIWPGDTVFLKLNCEGAECDILDDLLDSGQFSKVNYVMVDFDVRKFTALKHREQELRDRLAPYGFPRVAYCRQVMVGPTHAARIQNWITLAEHTWPKP